VIGRVLVPTKKTIGMNGRARAGMRGVRDYLPYTTGGGGVLFLCFILLLLLRLPLLSVVPRAPRLCRFLAVIRFRRGAPTRILPTVFSDL